LGIGLAFDRLTTGLPEQLQRVRAIAALEAAHQPQGFAPIEAQRLESVGFGEPFERGDRQPRPDPEIVDRPISRAPLVDQSLGVRLLEAGNLRKAEADGLVRPDLLAHLAMLVPCPRAGLRTILERSLVVRAIDIDRPHLDAMLDGVADELRR